MSRLTRRIFLFGSATIAGGVAFGAYKVAKPHPNPLVNTVPSDGVTFNPWIMIDPTGVTLITAHTDVGQGVSSMEALLLAEELDLAPDGFETRFAAPDAAYFNTALAAEAVPFMPTDTGRTAETMRAVAEAAVKLIGLQLTGGSSAVPDSFDKLRQAGAMARETLRAAASNQTGVAVADLRTENGAVILPDGARIPYPDLAATAATIKPVNDVRLRDPSEWRLIGKPVPRRDIPAKSTGQQAYGIDLRLTGMVFASVRLNPAKGGALNAFDASAARGMNGVQAVVPVTGGVAAVADTTWAAIQAVNAVDCDWGPADYPPEQDAHWDALAASFTEDNLDKVWREDGEVDAEWPNDAVVVEAEYRAPYVAHQPLEPLNATALVSDDGAEIWTAHQIPQFAVRLAAKAIGMDPDQITFYQQFAGGSFGHRLEFEHVIRAVEIANQMRGTPVQMTLSREEDFAQDFPRQISMGRMRAWSLGDRVDHLEIDIASPSVTRSQMGRMGVPVAGPDLQIAAGVWNMTYDIGRLRVRGYETPGLPPVSSWRSVGASSAGFFAEGFMDEILHAIGADPMAARIDMCKVDYHRKVLEAAAEMSDWTRPRPAGTGLGVAFVESFGVPVAEVVEVTDTPDGIRITNVWVAADVGRVVDPVNFENIVQGGVIWGLGHAMNSQITYAGGAAEQVNFWDAEGMRIHQTPEIHVRGLENAPKIRGIGEPPVPPAAPALANAIFAATGQRLREMPFDKFVTFA